MVRRSAIRAALALRYLFRLVLTGESGRCVVSRTRTERASHRPNHRSADSRSWQAHYRHRDRREQYSSRCS